MTWVGFMIGVFVGLAFGVMVMALMCGESYQKGYKDGSKNV